MARKQIKWLIATGLILTGLAGTFVTCTPSNTTKAPEDKEVVQQNMEPRETPDAPRFAQEKPRPPSDEQIFDFLEKFDPARLQKLVHLEDVDPEEFHKVLKETRREFGRLMELKKRDPERFEQMMHERRMEQETGQLAMHYRNTKNAEEKEKIKKEIRERLEKLFDLREAQKAAEIKRMEEELAKLKEKAKTRKDNRDKIIEQHQKELLGENDDMKW